MITHWLLALAISQSPTPANAPLPSIQQLRERAIANEKRVAEEEERYSCRIQSENIETDKHGSPKKTETEDKEQFYMNGHEVDRTLAKNGKPLSPEATKERG